MRLNISPEARELIARKGGSATVEAPRLESEGCCKTTLVPARIRSGRPRRTEAYRIEQQHELTIFVPDDLQLEGEGLRITVARRALGLRELVVEGVGIPAPITRYLEEERELGPSMVRLRRGQGPE